jgi:Hsp70 protein
LPDTAQSDDVAHAIGLSIGAAKLAGVAIGRAAVTRSAVLTRFPHRPPEVGLPSENPDLDERGLIITDFVNRVGEPNRIVASDGSSYLAAELVADALGALLYALTRGQTSVDPIGVAYPVHWRQPAINALRRALARLPEFGQPSPVVLVPDAVAALTALQDDPGVPSSGIIAVCDFGATGTSITLADASRGFAPIAETVRDSDLSGDVVDQALLTYVIADLVAAGSIDPSDTSEIGSLTRLRTQCRTAKERLSTSPVVPLTVELSGRRSAEVRVTRNDLDDALEHPLAGFVENLYEVLRRNRIHQDDLVGVASVGGGARMSTITTALSEHLRVPVITTGHPELNAAIGAGLEGLRASVEEAVTTVVPKTKAVPKTEAASKTEAAPKSEAVPKTARASHGPPPGSAKSVPAPGLRELEWSGSKHASGSVRVHEERIGGPRLGPEFDDDDADVVDADSSTLWYRHPFAVMAAGVSLVLAATATAAVFVLVRDDSPTPASQSISTSRTTPTTTEPPSETPVESPPESTVVIPPPPPSQLGTTVTEQPPRATYTQVPQATTTVAPPASPPSPSPTDSNSAAPPTTDSNAPPSNAPPSNTEASPSPAASPNPAVPPVP